MSDEPHTVGPSAAAQHLLTLSSTASQLAEGVLRMFWIKKATAASLALITVFGFGMGIGVSVNRMPGAVAGEGPDVELVTAYGVKCIRLEHSGALERRHPPIEPFEVLGTVDKQMLPVGRPYRMTGRGQLARQLARRSAC